MDVAIREFLARVLLIRPHPLATGTGTGFSLEVDGHQYLITAKHVLRDYPLEDMLIWNDEQWKRGTFTTAAEDRDVVALCPPVKLPSIMSAEGPVPSADEIAKSLSLGQAVTMYGFAYGLILKDDRAKNINNGFPLPIVKHGSVARIHMESGNEHLIIDGHTHKGMSGGPVAYRGLHDGKYRLAGVIHGVIRDQDSEDSADVERPSGLSVAQVPVDLISQLKKRVYPAA